MCIRDRVIALQRKNLVAKEELDVARQQVEAATAQLKPVSYTHLDVYKRQC